MYTIYFILGQLMWGFLPAFWRLLAMLDAQYILAVRILFSALLGYGWILAMGKRRLLSQVLSDRRTLCWLFGASIFITANWGLYIFAVNTGHVFQASLAYFMNPIVCLALSSLLFRERLGPWQLAAALTAAAGMVISFALYGGIPLLSVAVCLSFTGYSLIKKKVSVDGDVSVFLESLYMTVPSAIYVWWAEAEGFGAAGVLHGWEWWLLPATGVFTALPLIFFSAGIFGISFATASILMYMAPAIQLIMGFVYGEPMEPILLINFAFILCAVVLFVIGTVRGARKIERKNEEINREK